ncbi:DoxX family protein [uncultured Eudoraea sp.]|uniref:DoxX family protein n=1 Tax=uncultured Eudoraea sp. TaxID=1035614 RepID=UPI00262C3444|nr:DoxX family protein [uncultured Eudoraea sp.]
MTQKLKNDIGLAILRIVTSAFLLSHGIPKLQKLLAGDFEFSDPIGIGATPSLFLAVVGEFLCPILVLIGFKTRWASLPIIITMAVAAFIVHGGDPFGKKELALIYLMCYVVIMFMGPGSYSIDKK